MQRRLFESFNDIAICDGILCLGGDLRRSLEALPFMIPGASTRRHSHPAMLADAIARLLS